MIKLKDKKVVVILIVIAGLVLVAVSGFFLNSYLVQQSTLKELDRASQSLESVYDKLTEINRDNLASSSFTKDCSAPNRGPYDRIISCGPRGVIVLKNRTDIDKAKTWINDSVESAEGNAIGAEMKVEEEISFEMSLKDLKDVRCYVSYGVDQTSGMWGYRLVCRKTVSNFLPGYVVE